MNAKELIALLSNAHPDTPVCFFTEDGPEEITRADVYEGVFQYDQPKLIVMRKSGIYVGFGNPGDFEATESGDDCKMIFDLEDNVAVNT